METKTFFIADTHFGHKNVIEYENRPFKTIEEMDKQLIDNWNNTVCDDDTVYVLGDFSFYNKKKTREICLYLNGRKILIMGNHDTEKYGYYIDCGFAEVSRHPVILEDFWILSHEPLYVNSNMPYANIFGHVHNNPLFKDISKQSFCVSVERINYTPIDFEEIKKAVMKQSEN